MDYITVLFLMTMCQRWLIASQIFQVLGHLFMCPITRGSDSFDVRHKKAETVDFHICDTTYGRPKNICLASLEPPSTPSKKPFPYFNFSCWNNRFTIFAYPNEVAKYSWIPLERTPLERNFHNKKVFSILCPLFIRDGVKNISPEWTTFGTPLYFNKVFIKKN